MTISEKNNKAMWDFCHSLVTIELPLASLIDIQAGCMMFLQTSSSLSFSKQISKDINADLSCRLESIRYVWHILNCKISENAEKVHKYYDDGIDYDIVLDFYETYYKDYFKYKLYTFGNSNHRIRKRIKKDA